MCKLLQQDQVIHNYYELMCDQEDDEEDIILNWHRPRRKV